ncbi:MAG TPA: hypothetical protein VE732_04415 [Nitrososphaera sp.]|nr:hypothetical protein [Nitrososphaera sp.]
MPMTPTERKRAVEDKYGSINNLAQMLSKKLSTKRRKRTVRREELSMCIHGHRIYPDLQKLIAEAINRPLEEVFGDPSPTAQAA